MPNSAFCSLLGTQSMEFYNFGKLMMIIIIIFINCNWDVTRWQWLFYTYTNMREKKKG